METWTTPEFTLEKNDLLSTLDSPSPEWVLENRRKATLLTKRKVNGQGKKRTTIDNGWLWVPAFSSWPFAIASSPTAQKGTKGSEFLGLPGPQRRSWSQKILRREKSMKIGLSLDGSHPWTSKAQEDGCLCVSFSYSNCYLFVFHLLQSFDWCCHCSYWSLVTS